MKTEDVFDFTKMRRPLVIMIVFKVIIEKGENK